ncbi:MAG: 3-isopropylmalate dehydratase small subunit [bacterium]
MALAKITEVVGRAVVVPGDDIDTDRIIPARFMKGVTFDGLGEYLFYDVRFDKDGKKQPHPLNEPRHEGATVLISGNNFGCGSSREHAPQAIYRAGFRAVIAEGFAEIFFGNAITLGLPCVALSHIHLNELAELVQRDPAIQVTVDLLQQNVCADKKTWPVQLRASARDALIHGRWDAIGELLEGLPEVEKLAARLS